MEPGKERTVKKDYTILKELDDSESPDMLVLYFHYRDKAFDCFNAGEYHKQMLQYYGANVSVVEVVPRQIRGHDYFMVCLRHAQEEHNTLCDLAFTCSRQFCGISMLVKKRCFQCHKPAAKMCSACHCACFCSRECQLSGWEAHKQVCKLVKASKVRVEADTLELVESEASSEAT